MPDVRVSLRRAETRDAAEVARLSSELGYPVEPANMAARLGRILSDPAHEVLVATDAKGRVRGWVQVEERCTVEGGVRAELVGLIVDPTARRRGIGSTLIERVEAWAEARDLGRVIVRSNVAREASHPFYLARDYALDKTQRVYSRSLPRR
jgi:GNAT superfamily N-acetyltransferase